MEYRCCRPRDASRSDWRIPCHCLHRPVDASARIYECRRTQRRAPHRPRRLGTLFPHRNTLPGIDRRLWKSEKYRIFANVPANPPAKCSTRYVCVSGSQSLNMRLARECFPSAVCYKRARLMARSYMCENGIPCAANIRVYSR